MNAVYKSWYIEETHELDAGFIFEKLSCRFFLVFLDSHIYRKLGPLSACCECLVEFYTLHRELWGVSETKHRNHPSYLLEKRRNVPGIRLSCAFSKVRGARIMLKKWTSSRGEDNSMICWLVVFGAGVRKG